MRIYLDVCCWNRPFDDDTQSRVHLEAEAVLAIMEMAETKRLEIVTSDIINEEISRIPDDERREQVELLLQSVSSRVSFTSSIETRAEELQKWAIPAFDALHLASAESARVDVFLTTDDTLIRRAARCKSQLKLKIENPAKWLIEELTDET